MPRIELDPDAAEAQLPFIDQNLADPAPLDRPDELTGRTHAERSPGASPHAANPDAPDGDQGE